MMMHHDVNEDIAGSMIMALLDMLHRDLSGDQGGPNWAAWANGNSPMNWQSTRSAKSSASPTTSSGRRTAMTPSE